MKKLKVTFAASSMSLLIAISATGFVGADTPPGAAAPGSTFAQRLDLRKAERAINLNQNDQSRITGVCKSVQGQIRPIQADMVTSLASRTKAYQHVDAKLWVTIGELKLAGKDTFDLEKDRAAFAVKTDAFQTLSTNFSQTLDDIGVINCQADPVGFRALLTTAQIYYSQIITQSADNRDYVLNTIKPELANQITSLQTKSSTSDGSN